MNLFHTLTKATPVLLIGVMSLVGCNKDEAVSEMPVPEASQEIELAYPNINGTVEQIRVGKKLFSYERINGEAVFEGDIILTEGQLELIKECANEGGENASTGRTSLAARWPNKRVYYAINPDLSNKSRVYDAIAHWEKHTDIDFVKRSSQSNYVYFTPGSGCSSRIGMSGGRQNINLGSSCSTGNVIHEIGHAVGLFHEQSRADRDNYLTIHWDNIQSGKEGNFETYNFKGYGGFDNGDLDFNSIMMYSSYSFPRDNSKPTITRKDGSTFGRQRSYLSAGDLAGIKHMYSNARHMNGPRNVTATYSNGYVYVDWDAVSGASSYYVYIDRDNDGIYDFKKTTLTNMKINPGSLSAFHVYISAVDAYGNVSETKEPNYSWK